MKRSLTKSGASLVTTIPSKWVRKYGLEQGDEVDITIDGNRLLITTEKVSSPEEEKVILRQEDCAPYEDRVLGKFYIAGYNLVELEITDPSRVDHIKYRVSTRELGFEPLEETNKRILFTSVVTEEESQYQTFERKAFLTGLEVAKLTLQAFEENDPTKFEYALKIETTNTKFCAYCQRYLNKKGAKNYALPYVIIWALEKIVDEYKYIIEYSQLKKIKPSKQTIAFFKEVNEFFNQLYIMYYVFDMKTYSKLALQKKAMIKKGYQLSSTAPHKDAPIIAHLMTITRLTSDCLTSTIGKHAKEIARKLT